MSHAELVSAISPATLDPGTLYLVATPIGLSLIHI